MGRGFIKRGQLGRSANEQIPKSWISKKQRKHSKGKSPGFSGNSGSLLGQEVKGRGKLEIEAGGREK